jgi:hypothetical protein
VEDLEKPFFAKALLLKPPSTFVPCHSLSVESRSPAWQLAIKPASEISNPAFRKLMLYQWLNPFLPISTLADLTSSGDLGTFHDFSSNNAETETRSRDICITALNSCDNWA